jgi:hypothetical protein
VSPWRRRRRRVAPDSPTDEGLPTDPQRVLEALARHGVDYVTIGGLAVQAYGHVRTTKDVDIVVAPNEANLGRLATALQELKARLRGVDAHLLGIDPTDAATLAEGANFTLATTAGPLDVWTDTDELRGAPAWPELRERAQVVRLPNVALDVVIAGRDDLIALKRAAAPARASEAARRQDLDDITFLADPRRLTGERTPPDG